MLKELLKNKEFSNIIKEYLIKPEIIDVILFGSIVKGKDKPGDIDLLILFSDSVKETGNIVYEVRKKLEKISKGFEVIGLRYNEISKPGFFAKEGILSEGFSLKTNKFLLENFGYINMVLFKYELGKLNKSKRMQFYYGLYGRGKENGLLRKTNSYKFSDSVVFSDIHKSEIIKEFFDKWKIKYLHFPIIIPARILTYILKNEQKKN